MQASQQLSLFAQTALKQRRDVRAKVDDYGKVLERVYGRPENFDISVFMTGLETPITYSTFTMLLLYFIPQESLPCPLPASNNPIEHKILDFLPTDTHYRQLCKLIHPDRQSGYEKYQALANSSWELWKQPLIDPTAKNALAPPSPTHDPVGYATYCAQGEVYQHLAAMLQDYIVTWCTVGSILNPTKLSPAILKQSLASTAASRALLNASLEDTESGMQDLENGIEEVIAQGKLFSTSLSSQRRNIRRQNCEEDSEGSRSEDEEIEVDEEDVDMETEEPHSGSERLVASKSSIDPALRRMTTVSRALRPRRT